MLNVTFVNLIKHFTLSIIMKRNFEYVNFFFVVTLGITNRCIHTVISKSTGGFLGDDCRGKHNNKGQVAEEIKYDIRAHISLIPKIESHNIRANSDKLYIEGDKTIAVLYWDYKNDCEKAGKPFSTFTMYNTIFNSEFNLSFFTPKKDQCSKCVAFENAENDVKENLQMEYNRHQEEKLLSQQKKEEDKGKSSNLYKVAFFDLQAVLPSTRGEISSFYYKSKLSTYNFTDCELKEKGNGDVHSFIWHEGRKGGVEIGSCLLYFLKDLANKADSPNLEVVLYSDNCCGQQKNKFIISTFLYAVANLKIKSITHKFLVTGHTQNEGDAVFIQSLKNILNGP
ncbi:uncharacterized protein LOC142326614 isoform X1 [Lycorma delicatula]|uniref:uncharacterized protein LOC142326614 isoform X1 n=1 Tax=Lycorma delicatula TaxID=130591 RepID=UPI003F514593